MCHDDFYCNLLWWHFAKAAQILEELVMQIVVAIFVQIVLQIAMQIVQEIVVANSGVLC